MELGKHAEFMNICRESGWKCTAQRLAVYEFLQGNLTHPDVDTVWSTVRQTLPTITRESVYRILNEFSEKGMIRRLDQIENARYDSRTDAHGHFICQRCGKISDFSWPEGTSLPAEMQAGEVLHMEIRLVGVCGECRAADKRSDQQKEKTSGLRNGGPVDTSPARDNTQPHTEREGETT